MYKCLYIFLIFRNSTSSLKEDIVPVKDEINSKVSRQFNLFEWAVLTILSKFEVVNFRTTMGM